MMQRWNARAATAPDRAAEVSPSDSSSVDPFILDFGMSVNVNEDLRRTIRSEIIELDDSIVSSMGANKHEEMVEAQLQKDLAHSHTEMRNLSRGACDQLESAGVHASFLSGLENTLHVDLVHSIGVQQTTTTGGNTRMEAEGGENMNPNSAGSGKHRTNKEIFQEASEKLKTITTSMKQTSDEVDALFRKQRALVEKNTDRQKSINSDSLKSILEEKRKEADAQKAETEKELQRKRAMKSAIHSCRARTGDYAQDVADKTKAFNTLQHENAKVETELTNRASAAKDRLTERQRARSELESQHAIVSSQLDQYKATEDKIERFENAFAEKSAAYEKQVQEQDELIRLKKGWEQRLQEATKKRKESKTEFEDSQELSYEISSKKAANDEKESSVLAPGKEEIERLSKERERLAKEIGQHHEAGVNAQTREKEELNAKREARKEVLEQLSALKEELEGKQTKRQHLERVEKESKENWEREIADHLTLEEKYRLALEAEAAHHEKLHQDHQAELEAKIEEERSEADSDRAEKDRYLQILLYGAEIIENARETERKLKEEPIE